VQVVEAREYPPEQEPQLVKPEAVQVAQPVVQAVQEVAPEAEYVPEAQAVQPPLER
jgi:hypothetical protein